MAELDYFSFYPPAWDNLTKDPGPDGVLPVLDDRGVPVHRGPHRPRYVIKTNATFARELDSLKRQWPPTARLFKQYLESCRKTLDTGCDFAEARLFAQLKKSGSGSVASSSGTGKGKGKRLFENLLADIDHVLKESDKSRYNLRGRVVPEKEKKWAVEFCTATYQLAVLYYFIERNNPLMTSAQFDHYRECYYYHRGQADAYGNLILLNMATCNPEYLIDSVEWWNQPSRLTIIQPDFFEDFKYLDTYQF